ncbi:DUF2243 domain-containing protein [Streptosporangium sp. NPDC051023]|uniref:DUF2243 domain-containing protein n=1 Tax=Streptosporangium sp. NPDC051023 TaxID=3155410 RepID=UPI00344D7AE3
MSIAAERATASAGPTDLQLPGIVLGVGLGGFVDGILLHQLLQWHHMLSSTDTGATYYSPFTVPGLEMNTAWDGILHTVRWLAVLAGLAIVYARVPRHRRQVWTSRTLWGWVLTGWGLFNLVEGVLGHHILGVHHVHHGPYRLWWDIGFLVLGAVLTVAGYLLRRGGTPFDPESAAPGSGSDRLRNV